MKTIAASLRKKNMLFFMIILAVVFGYLGIYSVLQLRPCSVHMWAMCDRASVARNFAQDSMNFFRPRVHFTQGSEGVTGIEFPFVNYIAAICYKLFGFNELWYRLTMLIILSCGLFACFSISMRFTRSYFFSSAIPLFLLASPVLTFYAASFIPDTASLGLILCGWYFFFRYVDTSRVSVLVLMTVMFALASLIKITALISIVVAATVMLMHKFWCVDDTAIKHKVKRSLMAALVVIILTAAWYRYAAVLSLHEGSSVFLMENKPPQSLQDALSLLADIRQIWVANYYSFYLKLLITVTFVLPLFFIRHLNRLLFLVTYGLWAGNLIFFYLMMVQFTHHDYYIITLLPAVFFQLLLISDLLIRKAPRLILPAALISLIVLGDGMKFNRAHQEFRYDENCWLYNWTWTKDYLTAESFVRQMGIPHTAKVISIADESPDIALYFLNLKGWSISPTAKTARITEALTYSPEYFITNDSTKAGLQEFAGKLEYLNRYRSIFFFRIRK